MSVKVSLQRGEWDYLEIYMKTTKNLSPQEFDRSLRYKGKIFAGYLEVLEYWKNYENAD